jgi:hypothetical protein
MIGPELSARIVERNKTTRDRIERTDVWSLVTIAAQASQRQIVFFGFSPVLTGHDMVGLVFMQCHGLGKEAIFTAIVGSRRHQEAQLS